jgi:hypothetical protein
MGKATKDTQVAIRMDEKTRQQLAKEAEAARRKLSDYLRYLIDTHHDRPKNRGKS